MITLNLGNCKFCKHWERDTVLRCEGGTCGALGKGVTIGNYEHSTDGSFLFTHENFGCNNFVPRTEEN